MLRNFLTPNVLSYSATVSACEKNQLGKEGLHLLQLMHLAFVAPVVENYDAAASK